MTQPCEMDGDATGTLLSRLEADAKTPDHRMVIRALHRTLECDEERDMVVDLEDVCRFIDVRKDSAKRTLAKHFEEGVNFEVLVASEGNLHNGVEVSRSARGPCGGVAAEACDGGEEDDGLAGA